MEAEIKLIIEKNLPSQVGDILKQRLAQAESDAAKVKQLEEQLANTNQHLLKAQAQISEYVKFDQRNAAMEAREKACDEQERDLKVKTLEYQLLAEKESKEFSKNVALGLVRNTVFKENVFDNRNGPSGVDQYGNQLYSNTTVTATKDKQAE